MRGWKEVKISEMGKVITGNTPPRKNPELYGNHTIFIKPTDVSEDVKYTRYPEECYSDSGFQKYKKSLIPKGATCVVTIGSIGKKITKAHCDCFINQAMNAVIPNSNFDEEFVYYVLKFNLNQLKTLDSGTASGRENVSKSSFSSIKLKVPNNRETQVKIGSILSAYDDLIENNLKRIKLLEELAQRTYEEWFVKFTINGEKLEVNKETGLPDGWEIVKVDSILGKIKTTGKVKKTDYLESGTIPIIDQSRDFIAGFTDNNEAVIDTDMPIIVFGDHTRILKFVNFPFARGADGTQVILSKENRMPQHLFYFTLIGIDLSNYHYARHFKFLKDSDILLPDVDSARDFEAFATKKFEQIRNLQNQNRLLKESRDILLPRLMSGAISVEEAEMSMAAESIEAYNKDI